MARPCPPPPPALLLLAVCALGCSAKPSPEAEGERPAPGSASPVAVAAAGPKAEAPVVVPCVLDVSQPGPLRRAGRAKVRLSGAGLSVDTEVPALCGPLFNADVDALGVKAGEGLLFEACVPEGYLQLTARERQSGVQHLHHGEQQAGTMDVSFNRVGAATYSSRALPTDRVTLSADFWKASAELVLRDVSESGELRATLSFDCSAAP